MSMGTKRPMLTNKKLSLDMEQIRIKANHLDLAVPKKPKNRVTLIDNCEDGEKPASVMLNRRQSSLDDSVSMASQDGPEEPDVSRHWLSHIIVIGCYLLTLGAVIFNICMVMPYEKHLYVAYARRYEAILCVPIYTGTLLSISYLAERRGFVCRRDEPLHISNVQLLVIVVMTLCLALGFSVYFVPFIFVFWNCDKALETSSNVDKWTDILFYGGTCSYMLVIIVYSLQRARLESDKDKGFRHDYEHFIKVFNSCVLAALFIKIVVDKVYVVYRDMVCPNIHHAPHDHTNLSVDHTHTTHHRVVRSVQSDSYDVVELLPVFGHEHFRLKICDGIRQFQCDLHHLGEIDHFWTKLDKKLIRPFLYVVTAELLPLIFCLHRNSTSHRYWKTRPESPVARFAFEPVKPFIVNVIYRGLALLTIPAGILLLGYRMYLVGEHADDGPTRGFVDIDVARNVYNSVRIILFVAMYLQFFRLNPRRYTKHSRWWRLRLRNSYKTPLVDHASFDTAVISFTLTIKIVMVVADTIIVASRGTYTVHDFTELTQLISMIAEWLVLRNLLILNDSELSSWPLHSKLYVSLGALMTVAGVSYGYISFIEEFVKHIFDKLTLSHAPGPTSSMILTSVLITESMYFGVSLYYFTLGTCYLELFHRYLHMGAFSLGSARPKSIDRPRAKSTVTSYMEQKHSVMSHHSVSRHHVL